MEVTQQRLDKEGWTMEASPMAWNMRHPEMYSSCLLYVITVTDSISILGGYRVVWHKLTPTSIFTVCLVFLLLLFHKNTL